MARLVGARRGWATVTLVGAVLLAACDRPAPTETGGPSSKPTASHVGKSPLPPVSAFSSGVALDWFRLSYALTQQERLSPPVASRAFGYLGVALYESLVPGTADYQSLAGQLNDLGGVPGARHGQFHWPAVANATLAAILRRMYGSSASHDAITNLEAELVARFETDVPRGIVVASSNHGRRVAEFIYDWSTRDGFADLHNCPYTPPVGEGLWEPTPPGFLNALEPCWGQIRPFVLVSGSTCDPGPPPAYSSDAGSQFFHEAKEVYEVVNHLTPEQTTIAAFWSDDPGTTGTPPGHSVMIAAQVIEQQGLALDVAAETFAKVGIGAADAFITCWWTKYQYNLLRPITYVNKVFMDVDWTIPLVTPPFPEFTSGHSAQSGSAAQVLTDIFGDVAFTDHTHDVRGLPSRSFNSFFEAAEEAAISRLYGGIHFRSAIDLGVDQGRCVGKAVSALRFKRTAARAVTSSSAFPPGEIRRKID